MKTKLSSKGQVVLPSPIRRKLGLRAGEVLTASVQEGRIVLTRQSPPARETRIVTDPLSGLPVLVGDSRAPRLTGAQVHELLADFP